MIAEVNERYERQFSDVMTLQMLVAQLPKINAQVRRPQKFVTLLDPSRAVQY